jgi:hypothetical protein
MPSLDRKCTRVFLSERSGNGHLQHDVCDPAALAEAMRAELQRRGCTAAVCIFPAEPNSCGLSGFVDFLQCPATFPASVQVGDRVFTLSAQQAEQQQPQDIVNLGVLSRRAADTHGTRTFSNPCNTLRGAPVLPAMDRKYAIPPRMQPLTPRLASPRATRAHSQSRAPPVQISPRYAAGYFVSARFHAFLPSAAAAAATSASSPSATPRPSANVHVDKRIDDSWSSASLVHIPLSPVRRM